jgi:hypothetical protein
MQIEAPTLPVRYPGRQFQLWTYTVSHGQLLLRSTRSEAHPTRCEILFKGVVRMDLPALMDDVEVEVAAEGDVPSFALELGAYERWGHLVYRVRGRGFVGYVVALGVWCAEDDGEYYTPSRLLEQSGL